MTGSTRLPRATPESQGVDSAAIEELVGSADARDLRLHSLMVLRHGHVIAEAWWKPYREALRHMVFSVSKSFTSTAIGIAEAEGRLSVEDPILSFFPSYAAPEIPGNVRDLRVRHLLAMATGHAVDTMGILGALPGEDWVRLFLGIPLVYPPGTHFLYNSGASFVLSAVIQARTGQSVREYLAPRLFEPLGMETPPWETNRRGIVLGASGLRLLTEELAKLGQLYLQRGVWNGKRLLTEDWIDKATAKQVANGDDPESDWCQGYGFQFWRSRHDSYRADGAYGQFSLVLPEQDVVVAITAGTPRNTEVPSLVWDHLLPGLHAEARPDDPAALARLAERLAALGVSTPVFLDRAPARAASVSGRRISLPPNTLKATALTLELDGSAARLLVEDAAGSLETVPAGRREWASGITRLWPYDEMSEAVCESTAGWVDERTFELHQQCVETPFRRLWRFEFGEGKAVRVRVGLDLGFWAPRTEILAGAFS